MSEQSGNAVVQADVFDALGDLEENSAHVALVDYPWKFDHKNGSGRYETTTAEQRDERGKRLPGIFHMEPDEHFSELLDCLAHVLVDGSWLICFGDDRFQETIREDIKESEFTFRRNWAWSTSELGMGYYGRVNHWPIPVATLGETDRHVRDRGTLFATKARPDVDYPTAKPVELYRYLLEEPVIKEGERVLEPFCGSAPAAAVAAERGLDYWGCDTSKKAVRMAEKRFRQSRLGQQTFGGQSHV